MPAPIPAVGPSCAHSGSGKISRVPRRLLLVGVVVLAAAAGAAYYFMTRRPALPPTPGIALSLAETRAARVSDLRYEVTYTIPEKRTDPIPAHVKATFVLTDNDSSLLFDFAQPASGLVAMFSVWRRGVRSR